MSGVQVSIGLLKRIEGDHVDIRRIRDIYEIWMSRIRSKTMQVEEQIALHLEFILFCLKHGNLGWAHQAVLSLMKERDFSCHPMSNLVMGLLFCQLWYSNLTEEVKLRSSNQDRTPQQSDISGSKFSNQIVNLWLIVSYREFLCRMVLICKEHISHKRVNHWTPIRTLLKMKLVSTMIAAIHVILQFSLV